MKKLITICLLVAMAFTANAQDSGPTKEQTVEYIKAFYSDFKVAGWTGGYYYLYSDHYKITINETLAVFEFDHYDFAGKFSDHQVYEFDMKNIGALGTLINEGPDYCENLLTFQTINKKQTIKHTEGSKVTFENHFYLSIYRGTKCIEDVSQTQIYKAFNHLRKLCGAPEPISF